MTEFRTIGLHYDGDTEWTHIDTETDPDDGYGDGEDYMFVATVPAEMVEHLDAAHTALAAARRAIFDHIDFDAEGGRFEHACREWVGHESQPSPPHWTVWYAGSGRDDEWPVGGPALLTSFPSEQEARDLIESLPEQFVIHHHGAHLQMLDRDRLSVTGPHTVGGYSSGCYRCGHTKDEHADPD